MKKFSLDSGKVAAISILIIIGLSILGVVIALSASI